MSADVRSLLRQHRDARRIEHPHAAYSDSGKLLCTLCHEAVKVESLWDSHIRSTKHLDRLKSIRPTEDASRGNGLAIQAHKRKHASEDVDEEGQDISQEDSVPRKRSRPDMARPSSLEVSAMVTARSSKDGEVGRESTPAQTPPFVRRTSGTPTQGVELKIPSRPATPNAILERTASSSGGGSTPKIAPIGRSPLIPQEPIVPAAARREPADESAARHSVDEAEWAAFEAEVVNAAPAYDRDAVISAAPMTAADAAARSEEEDRERRRAAADMAMEGEREDATRALEDEFDEMEELETRVRKLKERREALRTQPGAEAPVKATEAAQIPDPPTEDGPGGSDEDDDDEEDDWDGFRFRA
jgi:zinc finger protein 830